MERKIAAITGAGSGIGEAAALKLASAGFDVAVMDIDLSRSEATARQVADCGAQALPLCLDVRDPRSVDDAFKAVETWRKCPDVLVNSAGILRISSIMDCSPDEFHSVLQVNVAGTFLCAQRAAQGMIDQRYGRIINLSSISAERAGVGRVAYGTSKSAVLGLTRQLAMELGGYGITVNSVAPGPISTPMTLSQYTPETKQAYMSMIPARRLGTLDEVVHAIAFLAAEEAGYVNGIMLAVDGGYLAAGVATTGSVQAGV